MLKVHVYLRNRIRRLAKSFRLMRTRACRNAAKRITLRVACARASSREITEHVSVQFSLLRKFVRQGVQYLIDSKSEVEPLYVTSSDECKRALGEGGTDTPIHPVAPGHREGRLSQGVKRGMALVTQGCDHLFASGLREMTSAKGGKWGTIFTQILFVLCIQGAMGVEEPAHMGHRGDAAWELMARFT